MKSLRICVCMGESYMVGGVPNLMHVYSSVCLLCSDHHGKTHSYDITRYKSAVVQEAVSGGVVVCVWEPCADSSVLRADCGVSLVPVFLHGCSSCLSVSFKGPLSQSFKHCYFNHWDIISPC